MKATDVARLTELLNAGFALLGEQGTALKAMVGPIIAQIENMTKGSGYNLDVILQNPLIKMAALGLLNAALQALCKPAAKKGG